MFSERNYNRGYNRGNGYYHAVQILIAINVFVFLLQNIIVSQSGFYRFSPVDYYFSLNALALKEFQIWRIVTYMFLHGGIMHILLNMWGLYLFGNMLEQRLGSTKFLLLYFTSGIIGGLVWFIFNFNSYIGCIGASGALFGVMAASAMMYPDAMIMLLIPPIPLKLKTFVVVYAVIETLSAAGGAQGNVAHLAHLGGLIGGYLFMRFLYPRETFDLIAYVKKHVFGINTSKNSSYRSSAKASKKWKFTGGGSKKNLDEILDKISQSGINSLTEDEMDVLRKARDNMKKH